MYKNNSPDTLRFIWFHLWPNAYKNTETAFAKQRERFLNTSFIFSEEKKRGYIDSLNFTIDGIKAEWDYHKDWIDVAKVQLPKSLPPGDNITIETPFFVKLPKVFSRLGHTGKHYEITQWYPKPAVYDHKGWHPMPYLDMGEFYSEFGSFDVKITLPEKYRIMATGDLVNGEVRTITNSSISGNEIPFADAGFENINISSPNYFETPRMIASKINEDAHLDNIDGNKSLNMRLSLATTDTRVSPIIDAQRVSTILTSNRVNDVITNYATDKRANAVDTDPTACQYISKEVGLQNSATSIKIFVSAHLNVNCDIRAFYAIGGVSEFKSIFTPFPGYSNLNNRGQIIAKEDSNGESDVLISKSNTLAFTPNNLEFKEYTFTADNLPSFRSYQIKIILTSTNQTYVPQMKDLRVIALA